MTKPKKRLSKQRTSPMPTSSRSQAGPSSAHVTPSPRKRLRASNFAVRTSSSKRRVRRRLEADLDETPQASIDLALRGVRQAVQTSDTANSPNKDFSSDLAQALKRADQYFRDDITDTSSTDEDNEICNVGADGEVKSTAVQNVKARLDKLKKMPQKQREKDENKVQKQKDDDRKNKERTPKPLTEETPSKKTPKKKRVNQVDGGSTNKERKKLAKSIQTHKNEIDDLKKHDPNFYKFLEENDSALLDLDDLCMDDDEDDGGSVEGEDDSDDNDDDADDHKLDDSKSVKADVGNSASLDDENEDDDGDDEEDCRVADKVEEKGEAEDLKSQETEKELNKIDVEGNGGKKPKSVDEKEGQAEEGEGEAAKDSSDDDDDDDDDDGGNDSNDEGDMHDGENNGEVDNDEREIVKEKINVGAVSKDSSTTGPATAGDADVKAVTGDRTGYSDDEESDDEEAEAAAEAGMANSASMDDDVGETDDEVYEEVTDEEADGEEREPTSEGDVEESEDDQKDGDEEDEDDFDMADDAGKDAGPERKGSTQVTVVDLAYLRQLKDQLKTRRALSACRELLKIFRAGRNILPKSAAGDEQKKKKGNQRAFANRDVAGKEVDGDDQMQDEDEIEDFERSGAFVAGKVRFVSSKAYQQAMNLAIIGIQDGVDRMLGKPEQPSGSESRQIEKSGSKNWNPTASARWPNLEPLYRQFMQYLVGMCERTTDPITLRFLLKRLEKTAPYMVVSAGEFSLDGDDDDDVDDDDGEEPNKDTKRRNNKLNKRVVRTAVRVWSSDAHRMSEATRLQAYLLLNRLARVNALTETVLRACYHAYFTTIAATCNSKSLPLIEFSIVCMVELFGINMGASYATGFSYIRELAMGLRSVLVSKDNTRTEVERVHNWSYINQLRLWARILGRYGDPHSELHPLVYPYVQVAIGVLRAYPSPRTFPLRLHITSFLNGLVADTGTFIPVVQQLIPLLRCGELTRRHFAPNSATGGTAGSKGSGIMKKLDWRSLLRVSDDVVKSRVFLNGLVDYVTLEIARFFAIVCRHVSIPELAHVAETALRKASRGMAIPEWKARLVELASKLQDTTKLVMQARAKTDSFSPHSVVSAMLKDVKRSGCSGSATGGQHQYGMLRVVPGLEVAAHERESMKKKMPVERWYLVEKQRVDKEYSMRDEKSTGVVGAGRKREPSGTRRRMGDVDNDEDGGDSGGEGDDKGNKHKGNQRSRRGSASLAASDVMDVDMPDQAGGEVDYVGTLDLDSD